MEHQYRPGFSTEVESHWTLASCIPDAQTALVHAATMLELAPHYQYTTEDLQSMTDLRDEIQAELNQ